MQIRDLQLFGITRLPYDIYFSSEGRDGKSGHFEMLQSPWDANNGDEEQKSKNNMGECDPEACNKKPDYIE